MPKADQVSQLPDVVGSEGAARPSLIQRAVTVLEHVAEAGGASARDIADATGIPLPSVYRIAQELVQVGYLIPCARRSVSRSATSCTPWGHDCTTTSGSPAP